MHPGVEPEMIRSRILQLFLAFSLSAAAVQAQTCLGYPAQQTGNVNFTLNGTVGQDFGGGGATLVISPLRTGLLMSAGAVANHFVVEPKETVLSYSAQIGWERYDKDNLIWCPIVAVRFNRGQEIDRGEEGLQRTNSTEIGAGLGAGFELERRGPLSFNPFFSARYTQVTTNLDGNVVDSTGKTTGIVFIAGLGVRINDAFQITPTFHGATFDDAALFFDLRFSIAFRSR
jgi:hypothetical protein